MKTKIITLLLSLSFVLSYGQNTDSQNAIEWCTYPITGFNVGNGTQELDSTNNGCLIQEHNSSWYKFTIITAGDLYIYIYPQNYTNNYDFALWGPGYTTPPTSQPIRCNATKYPAAGPCGQQGNFPDTGMDTTGINPYVDSCTNEPYSVYLTVNVGETYLLLVDNYNYPGSDPAELFTLKWKGTANIGCGMGIEDNVDNGSIVSTIIMDSQGKILDKSINELATGIYFIIDQYSNGKYKTNKRFIQ